MRLLIVSHSCSTPINQRLYSELTASTGWDCTLAVPAVWRDEFGHELPAVADPSWKGEIIPVPVVLNGNIPLHFYLSSWMGILRKGQFDAVYVNHEPYALATAQLCLANRLSGGAAFGFYSCQNIAKHYPPPFRWTEAMVYRSASFAFPITDAVAATLREKGYGGDLTVLPLPVDTAVFQPLPKTDAASEKPVRIGFVGRYVPEKGLRTLFESLSGLEGTNFELWLYGGGPLEEELRGLATRPGLAGRVRFEGYVPHAEMHKSLGALDILVLPSETLPNWKEQFGRVIPEALASGVAVVGSDSGEIPTLIRSSGGGLVVPEKKPTALGAALRRLVLGPEERRRFAVSGRDWVREELSLQTVAKKMAGSIETAVRKKNQK